MEVVVLRLIKELLEIAVPLHVVAGHRHVEIRYPCQLSVYVPLLASQRGPGWHASPSDRVLLIRVQRLLGPQGNQGLLLMVLVEELLQVGMLDTFFKLFHRMSQTYLIESVVNCVVKRWRHVVAVVPPLFAYLLELAAGRDVATQGSSG